MYLGLDLGTSELKAVLLSDDHRVAAVARSPLSVQRPRPLWSEQAPSDWWAAVEAVMGELGTRHASLLAQVRGIGLSGQMHGAVLLDDRDTVLRPAILWNDGRSGAACEAMTARVPRLSEITGNLAMPGFTAPKLWWVREHEPEVFARTARVLLPKDHLRLLLTGEAVTDCSDASGTLWLDVGARRWSGELLAACGLTESHMPRLVEGSEVSARLLPDLARRWGLGTDVLVAGGGGDNAASAVGMGAVEPGQGFVSLGTSGVIFRTTERFMPNPSQALHAFCHALPGRWHQMSVMLSAASAVSWATRALGFADEAALLASAESVSDEQREDAPLFLPYLSGERSPHNDPLAQGALVGLTQGHGASALAYAVVEGVSFGLLDGLRSFDRRGADADRVRGAPADTWTDLNPTGAEAPRQIPPQALSLVGGGARSAYWAQLLATVLDLPLMTHVGGETGGALGAARLAWLADGGDRARVCSVPPVARRFEPDSVAARRLAPRAERFRRLYPALRGATGLVR